MGARLKPADCGTLLNDAPLETWAHLIEDADDIENQQWADYEAAFAQQHELSLAYRYLPQTEEEKELVARQFPEKTFACKKGGEWRLTYDSVELEGGATIPLREVAKVTIENGNFQEQLILFHEPPDAKAVRVVLNVQKLVKTEVAHFKFHFERYWGRARAAFEWTNQASTNP